jgi:predicted membrane protein (TIGR00267 family)
MNVYAWLFQRSHLFALVIGLTDGILTALTLISGRLLAGPYISFSLALRIATGSALSGIFVYFTAEYSRLRGELVHAERQLNLAARGIFATTQLGKAVRRDTIWAGALSGSANFLGALFPLFVGSIHSAPCWLPIAAAMVVLGVMGVVLARTVYGRIIVWTPVLMLAGIILAFVGVKLHIV